MTTKVHLPPELARFVDEKVHSGEYPDVETLVNEALREKAERAATYEPWAHAHIEQALTEVRSGVAKYASFEIVNAWARSWGTGNELPKPTCT